MTPLCPPATTAANICQTDACHHAHGWPHSLITHHAYMLHITVSMQHSMASTLTWERLLNMVHLVAAPMVPTGKLPMWQKSIAWHKALQMHLAPTPCFSSQSMHYQLDAKPPTYASSVHTTLRKQCPIVFTALLVATRSTMMAMSAPKWPI